MSDHTTFTSNDHLFFIFTLYTCSMLQTVAWRETGKSLYIQLKPIQPMHIPKIIKNTLNIVRRLGVVSEVFNIKLFKIWFSRNMHISNF